MSGRSAEPREPLAIVGIGCRLPGAAGPAAYWSLLLSGERAIREVPRGRFDPATRAVESATARDLAAMRWGGFIDNIDGFDWRAMRIPRREAKHMDPQHRVLLEVAWEALEDAGLPFERVAGSRTGVFVGISWDDYARRREHAPRDAFDMLGGLPALAANRVSFCFGLCGPSFAVDANCTSSLTALHVACQSLWTGESDRALVAGVELMLSPDTTFMMTQNGLLSPTGRCATLSVHADGVVRGEGCGVLVLCRLSDVEPTDRVYALVRGVAINHNGRNDWIMAASRTAQEAVLKEAYLRAGVDPHTVDYVEIHGASTLRGDPIEMQALGAVVRNEGAKDRPCAIGSVKSSIGHLGAASGVAALAKVALSLHYGVLLAGPRLEALNPAIDLAALKLSVPKECMPFPVRDVPARAGVSSTSIGGCNAHAILEAAPRRESPPLPAQGKNDDDETLLLLPLSAWSRDALSARIRDITRFLAAGGAGADLSLRDICYTAAVRRSHHAHRIAVLGRSRQELIDAMSAALARMATGAAEPRTEQNDEPLRKLAAAYTDNQDVCFEVLYPPSARCVSLPLPAWQRDRLVPSAASQARRQDAAPAEDGILHASPAPALQKEQLAREPLVSLREYLHQEVRVLLELDDEQILDDETRFFEAGLTSVTATELARRLSAKLGRHVPVIAIFDHPSVTRLVEHLSSSEAVATSRIAAARIADATQEPIAIVGMACRFPGECNDADSFWQSLRNGIDTIEEVPKDRWDLEHFYDENPDARGRLYSRHGAFLRRVNEFDAEFFGISPREAASLDPQQCLLLELAWEALESAGCDAEGLSYSRTGVFAAMMSTDHARLATARGQFANIDAYYATGGYASFASGRLSYFLGTRGPSMTIDTACSSSLVAVHLACQSLRARECDRALAGGVSLMLSPELSIFLCKAGAMSKTGRARAFDSLADGMVRGEGGGIVVLKRLSDSLSQGDPILAVVRGSAVNHDGPSGGLTIPSGEAQQALLKEALQNAGVKPHEIGYVEAHGTATPLGDPIEAAALLEVLAKGRFDSDPRLAIGSVKTNIGHLDAAAGMAGLIKTILVLQHGEIPKNVHLSELNPKIDVRGLPVDFPRSLLPWKKDKGRRIAGVSAFGLSGTNAHVIVEEPPDT